MRRRIPIVAWLLPALFFCMAPLASADENQVWWGAAKAEAEREGYALMDATTLHKLLDGGHEPLMIDARADYEFEAGHIPGAANLEFDLGDRISLPEAKRQAYLDLLGPDKKRMLVIYCRSFR